MELREYKESDCSRMAELFFQTVHSVNKNDYNQHQLEAWAPATVDLQKWNKRFLQNRTIVVIDNENIVGFGDIDETGYLDMLYVDKDYQGRGIATMICDRLERYANGKTITTHASITAKPFFLHRGYRVIKKQEVIRFGVALTNYVMEKS